MIHFTELQIEIKSLRRELLKADEKIAQLNKIIGKESSQDILSSNLSPKGNNDKCLKTEQFPNENISYIKHQLDEEKTKSKVFENLYYEKNILNKKLIDETDSYLKENQRLIKELNELKSSMDKAATSQISNDKTTPENLDTYLESIFTKNAPKFDPELARKSMQLSDPGINFNNVQYYIDLCNQEESKNKKLEEEIKGLNEMISLLKSQEPKDNECNEDQIKSLKQKNGELISKLIKHADIIYEKNLE